MKAYSVFDDTLEVTYKRRNYASTIRNKVISGLKVNCRKFTGFIRSPCKTTLGKRLKINAMVIKENERKKGKDTRL